MNTKQEDNLQIIEEEKFEDSKRQKSVLSRDELACYELSNSGSESEDYIADINCQEESRKYNVSNPLSEKWWLKLDKSKQAQR